MQASLNDNPDIPGPAGHYARLLAAGELRAEKAQQEAVHAFQALYDTICRRDSKATHSPGILKRLFGGGSTEPPAGPVGLYVHGGVGRGKSMLMDLFFDCVPIPKKKRVHFHQFMLDCHATLHEWRGMDEEARVASGFERGEDDPIPPLARKIAGEARLLCFDEFQVSDVADAMILGRLFENLFAAGVVIVATSNRHPDTLYEGGLNRELFLPFIEMIKSRTDLLTLDGPTDFRLERLKGMPVYYTPVNEETTEYMREAFFRMTDRNVEDADKVPSAEIEVQGRALYVPKSSKGVAVFSFKRLCANPLGAADYLAIAWRYHTVFVVAIPKMSRAERNEAKRFVTLIDVLYENNVKLICSAAVAPDRLYSEGDGSFEFARTASRLIEMQGEDYLSRGHAV